MSGRKEGQFFLLPFDIVAITMTATLDLFKGTVRISKEFYDKLQEQIDKGLREEIEKTEKALKEALTFDKNKTEPKRELVITINEDKIFQQKVGNMDRLIKHLKNWGDARKEYNKKLRNDLSKEIEQQIRELEEKKKELEEKYKQSEPFDTAKKDENEKKAQELIRKCVLMSDIYPDWAESTISTLKQKGLTERILKAKEREINQKLNYFHNESKKEKLLKLSSLRKKFEAIPFLFRLSNNERKKFYSSLTSMIQKAELGNLDDQEIKRLETYIDQLRKKAVEEDKKARFKEAKDKAMKAFKNRGYSLIQEKDSGDYIELEGTKKDGRKAKIKILKPEAKDDMSPIVIEIDQQGYKNSEEWREEGKNLAWELESLGVIIDFEETSTHFNGKLLENAAQLLKKKIEQEISKSPVKVKIGGKDIVTIMYKDGSRKQIVWKENMSLNDVIFTLQEGYVEEKTIQKEALLLEEEA